MNEKIIYLYFIIVMSALGACTEQTESVPKTITVNGRQWNLVWHDEFNGSEVDSGKWNVVDGVDGINYNDLLYDTPDNVAVSNGHLIITQTDDCRKEQDGQRYHYCSGKVTTQNKFKFTYGRVEVRGKPPSGRGFHTAYWLLHHRCPAWLSSDETGCLWPPEIDIAEMLGQEPEYIYMGYHFGTWELNSHFTHKAVAPGEADYSQAFHIFAVEWDPAEIRWYVDGEEQFHIDASIVKQAHYPFIIILDTVIGGTWPLPPDETTPFPSENRIDYVRVYKDAANPNPPTPVPTTVSAAADIEKPAWIAFAVPKNLNHPAAYGIDGDDKTFWVTEGIQSPGQMFQIDLGQKLIFNRLELNNTLPPVSYELYVSNDDQAWGEPVAAGTGSEEVTEIVLDTARISRFIKIVQTGSSENTAWSINELRLYYNEKLLNTRSWPRDN